MALDRMDQLTLHEQHLTPDEVLRPLFRLRC